MEWKVRIANDNKGTTTTLQQEMRTGVLRNKSVLELQHTHTLVHSRESTLL